MSRATLVPSFDVVVVEEHVGFPLGLHGSYLLESVAREVARRLNTTDGVRAVVERRTCKKCGAEGGKRCPSCVHRLCRGPAATPADHEQEAKAALSELFGWAYRARAGHCASTDADQSMSFWRGKLGLAIRGVKASALRAARKREREAKS